MVLRAGKQQQRTTAPQYQPVPSLGLMKKPLRIMKNASPRIARCALPLGPDHSSCFVPTSSEGVPAMSAFWNERFAASGYQGLAHLSRWVGLRV